MARPTSRVCNVRVTGPLAPFADPYKAELKERGYTPLTAVNELRQLARLSRWLDARRLTAGSLTRERAEQFIEEERAEGHLAYRSLQGLMPLLDVLGGLGVLGPEPPAPAASPSDVLLWTIPSLTETGLCGFGVLQLDATR